MALPRFNPLYHTLLLWPLVLQLIAYALQALFPDAIFAQVIVFLLLLVAIICIPVLYYLQRKFITSSYPAHSLKNQYLLIVVSSLLPGFALTIGDLHGLASFGDNAASGTPFVSSVMFGLSIGAVALLLFTIGNTFTILTRDNSKPIRILGKICHVLMWLSLLVISYFAYAIAYSLRDPNTE